MPFFVVAVGLAVVLSYLRGGRLHRLGSAPLRWSWMVGGGVVLQLLVDTLVGRGLLPAAGTAAYALLLGSQLLVLAWVAANWHLPGMVLVALGLGCNAVVMAANGAMPVDLAAVHALGFEDATLTPGKHVVLDEATRLPWLADIFPIPLMRAVISVGDVILTAGMIPLVHALMTFRPPEERRRSSVPTTDADAH